MKRGNKKAISPVVATVLLIMMVVVIAMIIFLWFRNISGEVITKGDGENIKQVCGKVAMTASFTGGALSIRNDGTIPISDMKVKASGVAGGGIERLNNFAGLTGGSAGQYPYTADESSSIVLFPVLLGNTDEGERNYVCENNGYEVN